MGMRKCAMQRKTRNNRNCSGNARALFSFKFHGRETTNDKKKYNEELRNVTRYNETRLTVANVAYLAGMEM